MLILQYHNYLEATTNYDTDLHECNSCGYEFNLANLLAVQPNTDFLNGVVELNRHGEIIIDDAGATSEPGIFA